MANNTTTIAAFALLVVIAGGVYVGLYHRKYFPAYIAGFAAGLIWILSAAMNVWTGYEFGSPLSPSAGYVGSAFMLIIELIVPISIMYKMTTGQPLNTVVIASMLMAVSLSVFALWNGVAFGLNTHLANMYKAKRTGDIYQTQLEANNISSAQYQITPQQSVDGLRKELDALYNAPAKNLAGKYVTVKGVQQTVRDMTANCSPNTYTNSPRLYKKVCQRVLELEQEIKDTLARNAAIPIDAAKLAELKTSNAGIMQQQVDTEYKADTAIPMVSMLTDNLSVDCTRLEQPACDTKEKAAVKQVSSLFAVWVAIFFETAKNGLVFLFIAMLIPGKQVEQKPSVIMRALGVIIFPASVVRWYKQRSHTRLSIEAEHKGRREAELQHEHRLREEQQRNNIMLLDATQWMHNISFGQLALVVEFDKYLAKKKVNASEVHLLSLLLCRQYAPSAQIPIHATIDALVARAKDDDKFIKSVSGSMPINGVDFADVVAEVVKPHRLSNIVLPMFAEFGLVNQSAGTGGVVYTWRNESVTEEIFKVALKDYKVGTS